jgi:hypothetical protein
LSGSSAHRSIAGAAISCEVRTWCVTEPMAEFSCKMSVVAKAASVGDFAERLACAQQRSAMQKKRGVIQTKRIDEFTAGQAPLGKELLEVTQRYPCFGCHLVRTEIGIGEADFDDVADTGEQLVRMPRDGSDGANSAPTRS